MIAPTFLGFLARRLYDPGDVGALARLAAHASFDAPFVEVEGPDLADALAYFSAVGAPADVLASLPDAWRIFDANRRPDEAEPVPVEAIDDVRLATPDEEREAERLASKLGRDGGAW